MTTTVRSDVLAAKTAGTVWSWSKVKCFLDCPYRFYLKYIAKLSTSAGFFASYGSFIHSLLEAFLRGEATAEELRERYLTGFRAAVARSAPSRAVFESYFRGGLSYLEGISPPPCPILWVERRVEFSVDSFPAIGIADCLCENGGKLYLLDHKSRALKPRSGRAKPTAGDRELDEYFRQLYLYSIPVEDCFGRPPDFLCFNCFRTGRKIVEPYRTDRAREAEAWFCAQVSRVRSAEEFPPALEFFKCRHLCEMSGHCEYLPMFLGEINLKRRALNV